jgi:hypothetical protein
MRAPLQRAEHRSRASRAGRRRFDALQEGTSELARMTRAGRGMNQRMAPHGGGNVGA